MKKTIEQKTADTLLQKDSCFIIGGKRYVVAKPSAATLVDVSAEISLLPHLKLGDGSNSIDVLRSAKDCECIGNIIAMMVVGSKGRGSMVKSIFRNMKLRRVRRVIMEELSPKELYKLVYKLLGYMEINDFFALIAFLNEVNMTKATTTVSGQPSDVS